MGYILSTLSSCFLCLNEYLTVQKEREHDSLKKMVKKEVNKKLSPMKNDFSHKKIPHSQDLSYFDDGIFDEIHFHSSKRINNEKNFKSFCNNCNKKSINNYKLKIDYCD